MVAERRFLLDANVILRFLTKDEPEQAAAAAEMMQRSAEGELELEIPFSVVTETVFTLSRHYRLSKKEVSEKLLALLASPKIKLIGPEWAFAALEEFGSTPTSFGDACVAAVARHRNICVATFDAGFKKIPAITCVNPLDLAWENG